MKSNTPPRSITINILPTHPDAWVFISLAAAVIGVAFAMESCYGRKTEAEARGGQHIEVKANP